MTTPKRLIEKMNELIAANKIEFVGVEPEIENYGIHKTKGEWVVIGGLKWYLEKGKVVSYKGRGSDTVTK